MLNENHSKIEILQGVDFQVFKSKSWKSTRSPNYQPFTIAQMSSPESREPSQPEEVADEADERAARRKHAQEAIETSKLETAAAKAADDAAAAKIASDLGLEVAGGFQQTQAEIEKAAIQRETERRKETNGVIRSTHCIRSIFSLAHLGRVY